MHHSFYPDMSKYRRVVDIASKQNADKYISLGWELIESWTEPNNLLGKGQTIMMYRVGWPIDAGDPLTPPEASTLPKIDPGPSAN